MNRAINSYSKPILTRWKVFKLSEKENYGNSHIREFAANYPEIIASSLFCLSTIVYAAYTVNKRGAEPYRNKPFKERFVIVRPDDPEVKRLQYYSHMYNQNYKRPAN
ncbi:Hypothetical protein FKW44_001894 [Caligus rogercresseyi]|uniref:Uncharacterized protein n=1 Tax=Caligus rogercresseyi TaxID=217165 RepID=A0A7T8QVW9_CALRO|nr:Hypothetical protein FKW44_001894 [Caligus rogercresseyi]